MFYPLDCDNSLQTWVGSECLRLIVMKSLDSPYDFFFFSLLILPFILFSPITSWDLPILVSLMKDFGEGLLSLNDLFFLFFTPSPTRIDLTDFEKLDLRLSELGNEVREQGRLLLRFASSLWIYLWSLLTESLFCRSIIVKMTIFKRNIPKSNSF